jgi:hypothetical protein
MYYYADNNQQRGPVTKEQLRVLGIRPSMLVWREGMQNWQEAGQVPDLADLFGPGPSAAVHAAPVAHAPSPSPTLPHWQPPVQVGYQQPYAAYQNLPSGMAVASMVLGIISLVLFCVWYISLPCAITGLALGITAKGRADRGVGGGRGMAIAGIVCTSIALGIMGLLLALVLVGVGVAGLGM